MQLNCKESESSCMNWQTDSPNTDRLSQGSSVGAHTRMRFYDAGPPVTMVTFLHDGGEVLVVQFLSGRAEIRSSELRWCVDRDAAETTHLRGLGGRAGVRAGAKL